MAQKGKRIKYELTVKDQLSGIELAKFTGKIRLDHSKPPAEIMKIVEGKHGITEIYRNKHTGKIDTELRLKNYGIRKEQVQDTL